MLDGDTLSYFDNFLQFKACFDDILNDCYEYSVPCYEPRPGTFALCIKMLNSEIRRAIMRDCQQKKLPLHSLSATSEK